jgi:primosomal protein N''
VLLSTEKASLQKKLNALEKLEARCCNAKETFDTMVVNIDERIRELQDLFPESYDQN